MKKKTAVVTGAAGHVGANLTRILVENGWNVRACIYRDTRAIDSLQNNKQVSVINADVNDAASLKKAFSGADVIFHCAGHIAITNSQVKMMNQINVEGTANVVKQAAAAKIGRLVHFSSIHALHDTEETGVVTENNPFVQKNTGMKYDFSKAESEKIVLEAVDNGLDAVIVNPTGIIGPNDFKPSFTGQFVLELCKGRLPMLVKGGFNWVDVRDVCDGAIKAAIAGKKGERYILGNVWESVLNISRLISEIIGENTANTIVPHWLAHMGVPFFGIAAKISGKMPLFTHQSLNTLLHHRYISSEKAKKAFKWHPRPFEITLRDTVDWFRENGQL